MSLVEAHQPQVETVTQKDRIVNDFSIHIATVNGSGSQTANLVLMRAIFQMGVPVSGKNIFPSNIQGMPTWFTIRVNQEGFTARRRNPQWLVAMNPETAQDDVARMPSGAVVVYDEALRLEESRPDLVYYRVPVDKIVAPICADPKLRKLVRNMVYDGVLGQLLGMDLEEFRVALRKQFGARKEKAVELNWAAVEAGAAYAREHLPKRDPYWIQRTSRTNGKILIEGNAATALGAIFAGVTVVAWYPITPSSSLAEHLLHYLRRTRTDPETGKATYAVIQAEDELAALGIVLGAGWAGARAMTATSGPGISLMAELTGLGYYVEIPAVIVDVQRVGPSTGLPTRTQQGDLLSLALLSHGDTRHPILIPGSPEECFSLTIEAFELAERFQTPVFVMTDLDLGMNYWMSDPFPYPDRPMHRGKVLAAEDLERLGGFARYQDVDGDGVGYRTLPGTPHLKAAYFARGSGHDERASYSEDPDVYVANMVRLARKFETLRHYVPRPVVDLRPRARVGLICYGTSAEAAGEARHWLQEAYGLETSSLRLRAYPFTEELGEFIDRHERVYVIDQNRDAQMLQLLRMELAPAQIARLRSVRHYNGLPIDADTIVEQICKMEGL